MAVPTQKQLHRPILEILDDRKSVESRAQIGESLAAHFALSETDLVEMVPSGTQTRFDNRVYWALSYLKRAGLLHAESPGRFRITAPGAELLKQQTGDIESTYLRALIYAGRDNGLGDDNGSPNLRPVDGVSVEETDISVDPDDTTPDEQIARTYTQLVEKLTDDLLDSVMGMTPEGFERLSLDLLEKMGFGTPTHRGRSGDHGIDGVIEQDLLGLDKICVQSKQWKVDVLVPEQEVRNFAGSLDMEGATKGVFVTTARFSNPAKEAARIISGGSKFIRLIEGDELLRLLIEHEVGVSTAYVIKSLDESYFSETA